VAENLSKSRKYTMRGIKFIDGEHTACDVCENKKECIDSKKIIPLVLKCANEIHWILDIGTICDKWIKRK
jgi:hypothetical protein